MALIRLAGAERDWGRVVRGLAGNSVWLPLMSGLCPEILDQGRAWV